MQSYIPAMFIVVAFAKMASCTPFAYNMNKHCTCEAERQVLQIPTDDGPTFVEQHFCMLKVSMHFHNEHVLKRLPYCCCQATHISEMASAKVFYSYTPWNGCTVVPCAVGYTSSI